MQSNNTVSKSIEVLKWNDIYAILPYVPALAHLRQLKNDDPSKEHTKWILGFKKNRDHHQEVRAIFKELAKQLGCKSIIAIPPSNPEDQPNGLQEIFGSQIRRIKPTKTRKYNHQKDLSEEHGETYEIGQIKDKKILLIDDVCRTGKTINHYEKVFVKKGLEVEKAVLGIYYKHNYESWRTITYFIKKSHETTFKTVLDIVDYLQGAGWKISRAGAYKHKKEGKIKLQPDGTFLRKDVDKYAKRELKLKATGKRKQDAEDDLRRRELEKKVEKLETENEMAKLNLEIKQGQYFRKDQVFVELAARLGALEAGFKHRVQSKGADLIRLTEGNLEKVGEFIAAMNLIYDELLNEFAQAREFQVIIEGTEDEDQE